MYEGIRKLSEKGFINYWALLTIDFILYILILIFNVRTYFTCNIFLLRSDSTLIFLMKLFYTLKI